MKILTWTSNCLLVLDNLAIRRAFNIHSIGSCLLKGTNHKISYFFDSKTYFFNTPTHISTSKHLPTTITFLLLLLKFSSFHPPRAFPNYSNQRIQVSLLRYMVLPLTMFSSVRAFLLHLPTYAIIFSILYPTSTLLSKQGHLSYSATLFEQSYSVD